MNSIRTMTIQHFTHSISLLELAAAELHVLLSTIHQEDPWWAADRSLNAASTGKIVKGFPETTNGLKHFTKKIRYDHKARVMEKREHSWGA